MTLMLSDMNIRRRGALPPCLVFPFRRALSYGCCKRIFFPSISNTVKRSEHFDVYKMSFEPKLPADAHRVASPHLVDHFSGNCSWRVSLTVCWQACSSIRVTKDLNVRMSVGVICRVVRCVDRAFRRNMVLLSQGWRAFRYA